MSEENSPDAFDSPGAAPRDRSATLWRLLKLARDERGRLAVGTLALLVTSALNLLYPKLIERLIDGVREGSGQAVVDQTAFLLLALVAIAGLFAAVRYYLFSVAGDRIVALLRQRLYAAIVRQEVAFFDVRKTGELTNRLSADTTVVQTAVTANLSMLLRYGLLGIGALIILVMTSWQLTLVMLAAVPLVIFGMRFYGQLLRKLSRQVRDALARAAEVAEETIAGIRTVRAFAREGTERTRYNERVDHAFELARKRSRLGAIFMGVFSFGGYAAIALVLWYGGRLLVAGELTLGELTSFVLYTFAVAFALGALSGLWESFMRALGASERIFELLDREPTLRGGTLRPDTVEGRVRFDHVDFAYPTRPDAPVLRAFDLELVLGGTTALVGPSGAGKSTVRALLSRLYDPNGGQILLDDRDLRELDPDWLRSQVGVVAQEPILFAATIAENIRYGRPDATDAEVDAVAQAANATAFIGAFPEGTETLVGERGVRLSGGQKQRIAIARALLEDPRVLVLDEATSALDAESEHLVQTALATLMEGRTTLVIAHRLSTVMQADRVVVLDAGRVAESGTHDELMATGGLYRQLVERQFTEVPALFP